MSRLLLVVLLGIAGLCFADEVRSQSVTAYLLDGRKIAGDLIDCNEMNLKIATSSGSVDLVMNTLDRLEISKAGEKTASQGAKTELITLVDGSKVICNSLSGRDDRWTARSINGTVWDFPKGSIESVLFGLPSVLQKQEWLKISEAARSSDEMVISRPSDAIDRASGMVVAISPEVVEFSFDGQILQAPRTKLLGLLWYRSQEKRVVPAVQVRMLDGSRWEAITFEIDKPDSVNSMSSLRWTTTSGLEASAMLNEIAEINFSVANVVWLSAQTALSKKTFQRGLLTESILGRDFLLGPRFYAADGNSDPKAQDLHFAGPGEISFRVPDGFNRFLTKIRCSERARFMTTVQCEIWVGDTQALNISLGPNQLEAIVDIAVVSDKQIRMIVTCDSDLLLGTQLSWIQPRLTR